MWVGEGIITSVSYILYIFTVQVEISDRFMAYGNKAQEKTA